VLRGRETGADEETDRSRDHEAGVLPRQQDAGRRERVQREKAGARKEGEPH
jgi:hypothetical protein